MSHSQVLISTSHLGNVYYGSQAGTERLKLVPPMAPMTSSLLVSLLTLISYLLICATLMTTLET